MAWFSWKKSTPTSKVTSDLVSDGESRWWNPFSGGTVDTIAGEPVSADNLMTSAACYACTKALAETLAGLPGEVYRDKTKRRDADPTTDAHSLLVDSPNPEMDAFTFWDIATTRLINRGNFFAEIQRDGRDRPIALWPIHNSRVTPMREPNGDLYWQILNDFQGAPEFSDPTWRKNNVTYLSNHDMLNIPGFGSTNGVMAPGVLPGAQEIAIDFATRRYGGSFFAKGAKPMGLVEHPAWIDSPERRELFRQDINRIHSGAAGAHQIGVLWQGAKYHQVEISPEHAQFLETRKFTRQQICEYYGVPPAIIGDYEHSKFATADSMLRMFVMITLRNLVCRMEKAINRQVLNVTSSSGKLQRAFNTNLIFQLALDGLLRGDPKMQAETWRVYREMGVAKTNEVREDIGLNPLEGEEGEYVIVNGGMARLDKIDEQGNRPGNAAKSEGPAQPPQQEQAWNKQLLIDAITESGLVPTKPQVSGHDPKQALRIVAKDAVDRIHSITLTQIARWKEQSPEETMEKLGAFLPKQKDRLQDALKVCDELSDSPLSESISENYIQLLSSKDYQDLFAIGPIDHTQLYGYLI